MNNIDRQYKELLEYIIRFGVEKKDRTGTGTKSIFGWQIRHNMKEGFPLLTTKKMAWKSIVTELLWFLRGDTNIKYLVDNGCHIWDGDVYQNYRKTILKEFAESTKELRKWATVDGPVGYTKEEFINKIKTDDKFAKKWGELGSIYGKQWRNWEYQYGDEYNEGHHLPTLKKQIDQIASLINDLKTNPDSRRLMVNAWNVGELDQMVLPPCHYGFQVWTRELSLEERTELAKGKIVPLLGSKEDSYDEVGIPKRAISLMYNARSQDVPLGTPFNIASYSLLLMMIAKQVNMIPEELITNMGDCHIYLNQIDGVKEQLTRTPYVLPTVKISDRAVNDISEYTLDDVVLENYKYHSPIKIPLSN